MKTSPLIDHLHSAVGCFYNIVRSLIFGSSYSEPNPIEVILQDPQLNKELHEFLLSDPVSNRPIELNVNGKTFEVGVVGMNSTPFIPLRIDTTNATEEAVR